MRISSVSSLAFRGDDVRLAPSFHVAADPQALATVAKLQVTDRLSEICEPTGLFRGPIFKRIFAADPAFGRAYVTATDLEQAELRPVLSLSLLHGALLKRLELDMDTVVVSCSGVNLGKAFYVRPDMAGLIGSHDLIRVVPDANKIRPGYLFAYLDSRFGRSALRQLAHGGSIRHLEPHQLASLRIPRVGRSFEAEIHDLVFAASRLLSRHGARLDRATTAIEKATGLTSIELNRWEEDPSHLGWGECRGGVSSLRALNFDPRVARIRALLDKLPNDPLGELCDPAYFRGKNVFKREEASSDSGVMLLGQRAVFRLRPEGRFISAVSVEQNRLQVPSGTVLIPSHGTLGARELYCRAIAVTPGMTSYAFSGDFFRCVPVASRIQSGFLYAFLRSRYAFKVLRGLSSGGKQQELTSGSMATLPIPRLPSDHERRIAAEVDTALTELDEATKALTSARALVERRVDEAHLAPS